jgi:exopolysaccharide biosynthesis polyprenyl glycosylphosphotransferase
VTPSPRGPQAQQSAFREPATLGPSAARSAPATLESLGIRDAGSLFEEVRAPRPYWILTFLLVDVFALVVAAVTGFITEHLAGIPAEALVWQLAFPTFVLTLFVLRGAYRPRLSLHALDDLRGVVAVTGVAAMAVISLRVLLTDDVDASAQTARLWVMATMCLAVGRVGLLRLHAHARRAGTGSRATLIVGAGRTGHLAAKRLLAEPELGLRPVGFLDKEPMDLAGEGTDLPVLGASWDLEHVIEERGIEQVVIAFSTAPHHVLLRVVRRCRELGVPVSVLPRLFEVEGQRVTVERLGALPLVAVDASNPKGIQFRAKYASERVIAALFLVLVLPVLALAALAILVTMGRPVLFSQRRVGADGHEFDMFKLRTMRGTPADAGEADAGWADEQITGNGASNGTGHEQAPDRRTVVGRFLRYFSIDELPQLWNVIRGDMSLVGPRPERVSYVRHFEHAVYRYDDRHRVKSGMTGWAQVHGLRGRTSLADRVEWDNYYIENWTPWLDIKIILMTLDSIARGQHES